jgi:hypothetical protein
MPPQEEYSVAFSKYKLPFSMNVKKKTIGSRSSTNCRANSQF